MDLKEQESALKTEMRKIYGNDVYNTEEMQEKFSVESFMAPYVMVTEKSTGLKGSLQFTHMPRLYFSFK